MLFEGLKKPGLDIIGRKVGRPDYTGVQIYGADAESKPDLDGILQEIEFSIPKISEVTTRSHIFVVDFKISMTRLKVKLQFSGNRGRMETSSTNPVVHLLGIYLRTRHELFLGLDSVPNKLYFVNKATLLLFVWNVFSGMMVPGSCSRIGKSQY